MTHSLYVLIPTYGRAPLLARTLASLAECALPASYAETVVVENGPQAGAEAICQQADARLKVRYLHVEKANKSHALNEALKTLPEDAFVVFFDDDVRFAPEVLIAYAKVAKREGLGHFFGGPVNVDYEEQPPSHIRSYLPASARGWQVSEGEDKFFLGANWAAFKNDMIAVRGFDINRGPGTRSVGQETDMQTRMKNFKARPVYVPKAVVWHYVPKINFSKNSIIQRQYRHGFAKGLDEAISHGLKVSIITKLLRHLIKFVFYRIMYLRSDAHLKVAWEVQVAAGRGRFAGYMRGLIRKVL